MEQLKSGEAGGADDQADVPAADAALPIWRRLPRRLLFFAAAGVLLVALLVAGVFAYRDNVKRREVEAALQQQRAQAAAAAEAAAEAEAVAQAERGRKAHAAHDAILAASPPLASLPPLKKPEVTPPVVTPSAGTENAVAVITPPPAADKPEPEPAAVTAPTATGDCTLTGGNPAAYGEALSRCLQEFNRLEGRKP